MEAHLSNLLPSRYQSNAQPAATENRQHREHDHHARKNDTVFISQQAQAAYSEQQSRQTSIEITTRDGDKVTINLSSSSSYQSGFNYSDVQSKNSREIQITTYESKQSAMQYQFSVDGHLDSEERKAIEDLVQNISQVADEIYQGDIKSAFKQAASLEYDTNELQSYAFDISQSRSRQYTAAYEEVAQFQTHTSDRAEIENNFSDLLGNLKTKLESNLNELRENFQSRPLASLVKQTADFFDNDTSHSEHENILFDFLDNLLDTND